jgi:N utilization substance protein A
VESLADMTPEQLEAIEGIGPKTVEKISIAVNNYFASLDGGEAVAAAEPENSGEAATEAVLSEESLAEGTVEADALAAEPDSAGEAESPVDGELEAAKLAAEAEPPESAAKEVAEAATDQAPTEEAPEDKQS